MNLSNLVAWLKLWLKERSDLIIIFAHFGGLNIIEITHFCVLLSYSCLGVHINASIANWHIESSGPFHLLI